MIAAVLAAAALAAPQPQLLVVSETRGFVHDSIPAAKAMVGSLGYRTRFLRGARELTAARLRGAGAVVFLNTSGDLHLDAAGRRRLLAYVRGGGAFVGAHAAADTFPGWPAFHRMLGADFPAVAAIDVGFTSSNTHTVFRGLIEDFGTAGSLVVVGAVGFVASVAYRRVVTGHSTWVAGLTLVYAFLFTSMALSPFAYMGPAIAGAVFVTYVIFAARPHGISRALFAGLASRSLPDRIGA